MFTEQLLLVSWASPVVHKGGDKSLTEHSMQLVEQGIRALSHFLKILWPVLPGVPPRFTWRWGVTGQDTRLSSS